MKEMKFWFREPNAIQKFGSDAKIDNIEEHLNRETKIDNIEEHLDCETKIGVVEVCGSSRSCGRNGDTNTVEENPLLSVGIENTSSIKLRDHGYAWIVLISIFISTVLTQGYNHNFGIISSAVLDFYPDSSGTMAGVIMGLLSASRSILAPFVGTLGNKVGLRKSMCFGAFLFGGSLFLSFFCTSMAQLSVTLGIFIGLSHCVLESCQITVMSQYFVERLAFASGVRGAASPLGGVIYPVILTVLLEHLGLKLTFLILAAISLHTLVCSLLMRPLTIHLRIKALEKSSKIVVRSQNSENILKSQRKNENVPEAENCRLTPGATDITSVQLQNCLKKKIYFQIMKEHQNIKHEKPKKKLEVKFFKEPIFLLLILASYFLSLGIPLVTYYAILYTKNYLRMTAYDVTILVSFQAAFDFVLRILIGYINNKNILNKFILLMICLWASSIGTMIIPFQTRLTFLVIGIGLFTLGQASFTASIAVILCEDFGKENIASTWGFVKMAHGFFAFANSLLIGYIVDATGGYTIPFVTMGCGMAIAGSLMGIQVFVHKLLRKESYTLNTPDT